MALPQLDVAAIVRPFLLGRRRVCEFELRREGGSLGDLPADAGELKAHSTRVHVAVNAIPLCLQKA
jgi:hypothetical protein